MKRRASPPIAVAVLLVAAGAAALPNGVVPSRLPAAVHAHEGGFVWDDYRALLRKHVDDSGVVYYRGLKRDSALLRGFAASLAAVDRREYAKWPYEQKIAFWINAYNGLTLKVIVDNYPIEPTFPARLYHPKNSIRQIKGVWDEVTFNVMGTPMTLEDIEHGTLREEFDEPLIHMALVCAAMGCPPLRNEPYVGDRLEEQFADQSVKFLATRSKFRIDRRRDEVHLSPIFKWFGEDFVERYGTSMKFAGHDKEERAVLNCISPHLGEADRRYLETADYDIEYLDYDWSLNERQSPVE
jgi:hypothetical protein